MKTKLLDIEILCKGSCSIGNCISYIKGKDIMCIVLETSIKWGDIIGHGSDENNTPSIIFQKDENDEPTEVLFSDLSGWTTFCSSFDKYDIHVCLVKK